MFLNREAVKKAILDLYQDNDDEEAPPPDVNSMSDEELLTEYCGSGLFQDNHPNNYEEDIEGLV